RTGEPQGDVSQQTERGTDAHDKSKHLNGEFAIVLANKIVTIDVAPDEITIALHVRGHAVRTADVHDLEIGNVSNLPARPTNAQAPIGLALEGVEVLVEHTDIFNHLCPHHEKVAVQPSDRFPGGDRFIDAVVPESGGEYDIGNFRSHSVHQGRGLLIAAVRVDGSASGDPY